MSEVKWTKEQLQAIEEQGSNILVAAAAGSGKTAVLVERIIHKILEQKIDIDKMLVVTFTNAAASEMRERILEAIYKKLEQETENSHLQRQIMLLNKASICTIHSFCLDVIRNHFYELDLPSNFRIADTTEIDLLKQEVLEDLFEQKYLENNQDFIDLLETYTNYHGDEALQELILSIYRFIQSIPYPEKWLEEKLELFSQSPKSGFETTEYGQVILNEIKELLEDCILRLQKTEHDLSRIMELTKFRQVISEDIIALQFVLQEIDSWDNTYQAITNMSFSKWPVDKKVTIEQKEDAKQIRDGVKKVITEKVLTLIQISSSEIYEDFQKIGPILQKLSNIVLEFSSQFAEKKREKNCIDFNDIEHFALKILLNENGQKTVVAEKYAERFQEIAIDEYQDSNLIQEAILTSISKGNNIFMVGDIKQSVYQFRQACPELFLQKYTKYKEKENRRENEGLKIQLFRNFRSRQNILDIANLVFESIMSKNLGDIDYNENEYLNYGANYPELEDREEINYKGTYNIKPEISEKGEFQTELDIIDLKETETITAFEGEEEEIEELERVEDDVLEARFVANRIQELLKSDYLVYDRKKGYRPIKAKDIVILLRATSNLAPIYEKELSELELPVFSDSSTSYLESVEIETILAILKIINNPMQDIPLVIVLRSIIGNFTDNELMEIRLIDRNCNFYEAFLKTRIACDEKLKEKIDCLLAKLGTWKEQSEYLPLEELIWQIYLDTGYYQYVGLLPNGAMRQANLKTLFEKAKQYESASFKGLFHFIQFIEKLKKQNGDLGSSKLIGENEDVVRIMSIHKSKGLEFPIVFLCNTQKKFNLQDLNNVVLLHQDLGFGPTLIDTQKRVKYNTVAKQAIGLRVKRQTLSEEERILYVALTRAKEKLIITGRRKDYEKSIKSKEQQLSMYPITDEAKIDSKLIKKCSSYLDWIEYVYLFHKDREISLKGKRLKLEDIITLNTYRKQDLLKQLKEKEVEEKVDFKNKIKEEVEKQKNRKEEDNENNGQDSLRTIHEKLSWKYPCLIDTKLPTKTSVSKLKQEKQNELPSLNSQTSWEEELDDEIIEKNKNTLGKTESNCSNLKEIVPRFLQEKEVITPARIGTLVHLCIQKLNEKQDYTKQEIQELVSSLIVKEIITEEEAEAIDIDLVFSYTKSSLFQELKEAREIHKEQPFYLNIPAKEIFLEAKEQGSEKKILVQGMIDLYYVTAEDELCLVDFKTDYIPKGKEQDIADKYKLQIEIYKKALEQAMGKKVKLSQICLANSDWIRVSV